MNQLQLNHAHGVLQETWWKTGDPGIAFLVHGSLGVGTCLLKSCFPQNMGSFLPDSQDGLWGEPSRAMAEGGVSGDWWRNTSEIYSNQKASS